MGWTFGWDKKGWLIEKRTKNRINDQGTKATCLGHSTKNNVLWTAWQLDKADGSTHRYIGCDLLKKQSKDFGWGYKDMDESVGPYYYTCPLKFLAMVPEVANQDWRDIVVAYHAKQKAQRAVARRLVVGQRITLIDCDLPYVTITSKKPLLGVYGTVTYRIQTKYLPVG